MRPLIEQLETPYEITRTTVTEETDHLGRPLEPLIEVFESIMWVHRDKRSDYQYQEHTVAGSTSNTYAKVRALKHHGIRLKEGDTFLFEGRQFKILKSHIYQENAVDFYSYHAMCSDSEVVV